MAPSFNLPVRSKSLPSLIKHGGRIGKQSERGKLLKSTHETARQRNGGVTASSSKLQVRISKDQNRKQRVNVSTQDIDSLTNALASSKIGTNSRTPKTSFAKPKRRDPSKEPDRAWLRASDAADEVYDALKDLERIDLVTVVPLLYVHFFSYFNGRRPVADPLVIRSSETESLVDLTAILVRRRRIAFRESDYCKQSPVEYTFVAKREYIEIVHADQSRPPYRRLVREEYSETCTQKLHKFDADNASGSWGNPEAAYLRLLAALNSRQVLGCLIDGVQNDCVEVKRDTEPVTIDDLFEDGEDEIYGVVEVCFK